MSSACQRRSRPVYASRTSANITPICGWRPSRSVSQRRRKGEDERRRRGSTWFDMVRHASTWFACKCGRGSCDDLRKCQRKAGACCQN
eukprot:190671-Rhodomonas_salina.2